MPLDPITGEDLSKLGEIDPYERGPHDPRPIQPPQPPPLDAPPPPAPPPARTEQAAKPPQTVWVYIRSANSFPGNHPNYADLKEHGVGGVLVNKDDPYRDWVAQTAHDAGMEVGVWADPHGQDPATFAASLAAAQAATGATLASVDLEFAGKGFPGTPEWDYSQALADAVRSYLPYTSLQVTPPPLSGYPTDYNFGAWVGAGASVLMQTYGSNNEPVMTPEQVLSILLANGVPRDKATVVLAAGALKDQVALAQKLGLPYWSIWTIDDINAEDRTVPFGESPAPNAGPVSAPGTYDPAADLPSEYETVTQTDNGQSVGDDELGLTVDPDTIPWDTPEGVPDEQAIAELDRMENPTPEGRTLQFVNLCALGRIHQTMNLPGYPAIDFFGRPGWNVLAPVDGQIVKLSGHDPRLGAVLGQGGPFGLSIYLRADFEGRSTFYMTHFGSRTVRLNQHVQRGQVIGTIGDYPGTSSDHIHVGVHGGNIGVRDLCQFHWFSYGTPTTVEVPGQPSEPRSSGLSTADIGREWHGLMLAIDRDRHASAARVRQVAGGYLGTIK